jgi:hypothetical protein
MQPTRSNVTGHEPHRRSRLYPNRPPRQNLPARAPAVEHAPRVVAARVATGGGRALLLHPAWALLAQTGTATARPRIPSDELFERLTMETAVVVLFFAVLALVVALAAAFGCIYRRHDLDQLLEYFSIEIEAEPARKVIRAKAKA